MMNALAELLKGWESFYLAVATAAATLMGLLFVALSVNLRLLRGPKASIIKTPPSVLLAIFSSP